MYRMPSLKKILTVDFVAYLGWMFPVVVWVIGPFFFFVMQSEQLFLLVLLIIVAGFTLGGLGVLIWRVLVIKAIFEDGIEVAGTLRSVVFFRDRGRVEYVYTYLDQKYASGNAILKTAGTKRLQPGMQVTLVVDRSQPRRAFIRDLYLEQSGPARAASEVENATECYAKGMQDDFNSTENDLTPGLMEIEFHLIYEFKKVKKVISIANRPGKLGSVLRIGGSMIISGIYMSLILSVLLEGDPCGIYHGFLPGSTILFPILFIILLYPYILPPLIARLYWKASKTEPLHGFISSQGIALVGATGNRKDIRWEEFSKIRLQPDLLVLVSAGAMIFYFEPSCFDTAAEWRTVTQWAQMNVVEAR
jgi:hypothetical protein